MDQRARHSRYSRKPFRAGHVFGATLVRICYGLSGCSPPSTDLTGLPANGGFYFQAFSGSVALPAAGYNYNSVWTPLLAGLSPAGMAASLAALARPCSCPAGATQASPAMLAVTPKAEVNSERRDRPIHALNALPLTLPPAPAARTSSSARAR